jgi:prepilin-type N-terminal cleavage/methylation domain-containing protein
MQKIKKNLLGFTLIELLVVVGILTILLTIVLIAINPVDQINKANDIAMQTSTKDFTSANKYYFAEKGLNPWNINTNCKKELSNKLTLKDIPDCVGELGNSSQIETNYSSQTHAKDIYVTECANSIATCFKPKSNELSISPDAKYYQNGSINPNCPNTNNNKNDCFVCMFTTNDARQCFDTLSPNGSAEQITTVTQKESVNSCSAPTENNKASCTIKVVTNSSGSPLSSLGVPSGLGPAQLHTAYNLPCTPGGNTSSKCETPITFGPQTIAIVDAYSAPTIENDLNVYNQAYGLPPCTTSNGCLTIVNQNGQTSPLPVADSNWALETSLDVQMAHAICQTCKILLVSANSNYFYDLAQAVNRAAIMGANAISNSYGGWEYSGQTSFDSSYNHPGVYVTVSSGDWGYGANYPASSTNVIGVGGTTLYLNPDNSYASETAWSGAGSGCSLYEYASSNQIGLTN